MRILGVWDGHDAGAALLIDGQLVAAVNEERLTRRKLEIHFPSRAIAACLDIAHLSPDAVDVVAMSTTDIAKTINRVWPSTKESYYQVRRRKVEPNALTRLTRLAKYRITEWRPTAISAAISRRVCLGNLRASGIGRATLRLYDHHACHAAAAAHASGFDSAIVITLDGVGDGRSASVSLFRDGRLEPIASTPASCSPGVFFEHVTHLLNMRELEDEGKVMVLSDCASPLPDHANPMLPLLTVSHLQFRTAVPAPQLVGPLRRILWRYPNEQFAFMAQRTLERACTDLVTQAVAATGESRVVLAGGIASNIKVNRRIRLLPGVDDVYVFPHMGDGGLALGAAVLARSDAGDPTVPLLPTMALGPEYGCATIERALTERGLRYQRPSDISDAVAELIAGERVVMWMQGRMEYGPRSLGQRSVLARPDRPALRDRLNLVLKRRVWYQPFCPSLLDSETHRLADFTGQPNRHMTMAYVVAPAHREALAGVINFEGLCRPQMVPDDEVGPFADLLRGLRARIGIGAVLNTSFNLHGSPLVCSPDEALDVFTCSGADAIAMGPYLVLADGLARP